MRLSHARLGLCAVMLIALGACDGQVEPKPSEQSSPQVALATATPMSVALMTPLPLPPSQEQDVTEPSPTLPAWILLTPVAVSGRIQQPSSGRVVVGQLYNFAISTHCGVDNDVDFDGSFWIAQKGGAIEPLPGSTPSNVGVSGIEQQGTILLLDSNRAQFRFDSGVIVYVRHVGPKVVILCE